eukprot:gene34450-44513_t
MLFTVLMFLSFAFFQCRSFSTPRIKGLAQSPLRMEANSVGSNIHRPISYVILSNIQSGSNIGNICRNCLAFNVSEVIIIGRRDFKQKMYSADRGAKKWLRFKNFLTYPEAVSYVKDNSPGGCNIIGIEITESSQAISPAFFSSLPYPNSAFLFGNEGTGMSIKQRNVAEHMVHIPQFASSSPFSSSSSISSTTDSSSSSSSTSEGTMASINVACASAIVLFQFATWAGYEEGAIQGEKFA